MTLLDRAGVRPVTLRLRRLETGVSRLAGVSPGAGASPRARAGEAPVILLPDLAAEVLEAVAPLLARRREVFVVDAGSLAGIAAVRPGDVGSARVAVVGGALAASLAAGLGADLEAAVVVGSFPLTVTATATANLPGPMLRVTSPGECPSDVDVHAGSATAVSGHPVETAHLIDSFLHDPHRYPAGSRLERARP